MRPHELPVYAQKARILEALAGNQVIVVESPTGSGKTTQIPLILHEAGYAEHGVIGVTQPRRIAALSVSDFIARQTGSSIPGLVGYKMRFEDKTNRGTRIKIMTDGILLQELKGDYTLSQYSVIMVDEAHERSLNIDFILGLLKRVLDLRPNFKVIISSATINAEMFSSYFNDCPVVKIDAQMYPVGLVWEPPDPQQGDQALEAKITGIIERALDEKRKGDVLIFLSGEREIKECMLALYGQPWNKKLHILPLYARLSREEQEQVFIAAPRGKTKVIVATNIAETSVTIDGITSVIDSGLAKLNYYNPRSYTSSLVEGPISKASCNQRKGRAGRTAPGTCYRLYSRQDFEGRALFTTEEIFRTDLSEVVLRMAELGISDFESFDFISPPGRPGLASAVETLMLLDALTPDHRLSRTGEMMARFPLLPRHSRMIVEAILKYPDVLSEVLIAAAFLTSNSPFLLPQGEELAARKAHHAFQDPAGDFISYLRIFEAHGQAPNKEKFCQRFFLDERIMAELRNVQEQLALIVSDMGVPLGSGGPVASYLCAVSRGLIQFVCARTAAGVYRSLTAEKIKIHPGSVMYRENPRFIVAGEIVRTSRMYARSVSPLHGEWLKQISSELVDSFAEDKPGRTGEKPGREERKKETRRETTWQITIGHRIFRLQPLKGKKKMALLPWQEFAEVAQARDLKLPPNYSGIRGKLLWQEREFGSGERLPALLLLARMVDPRRDLLSNWTGGRKYSIPQDCRILSADLSLLLKLVPLKKERQSLGFLSLDTDGKSRYWFRPLRSFFSSIEVNLAALERLVDELAGLDNPEVLAQVSAAYRRMAEIMDGREKG
jgi:ATP-dependent helicase HrpA